MWFVLGIVTLAVGLVLAELLVRVSPKRLFNTLRWIGLAVIVVVAILLVIGVRNIGLGLLTGMALALLSRSGILGRRRGFSGTGSPHYSAHQSSQVETQYLRMSLDHDSGNLDGEILAGSRAGDKLSSLSFDQLMDLYDECECNDAESLPLLEAFLDRAFGDDWREKASTSAKEPSGVSGQMTEVQALEILGLAAGATAEEVRSAHRRLMMKMHPDKGGSDFLARQINAAKECLLAK